MIRLKQEYSRLETRNTERPGGNGHEMPRRVSLASGEGASEPVKRSASMLDMLC